MCKNHLTFVLSDLFDITNRVKEIDERYYIVFNHLHKRYEVHVLGRIDSLAIVVDGSLDCRTINKLLKTHVRRQKQLLDEIIKSEQQAEKQNADSKTKLLETECESFIKDNYKSR